MGKREGAWVTLVYLGDAYVPGALTTGYSARATGTRYDLVCMVDEAVSPGARTDLEKVYDYVIPMSRIDRKCCMHMSEKTKKRYPGIDSSFTRANVLLLTDWKKIVYIDSDVLFLKNSDELFDLESPASCFNFIDIDKARPDYFFSVYTDRPRFLDHGEVVPARKIMQAITGKGVPGVFDKRGRPKRYSYVGGAIFVLEPDREVFDRVMEVISATPCYCQNYPLISACDEVMFAEVYASAGVDFRNIHHKYTTIPWKHPWDGADSEKTPVSIVHYLGTKPWLMGRQDWPDLADWWKAADLAVAEHTGLAKWFRPVQLISGGRAPCFPGNRADTDGGTPEFKFDDSIFERIRQEDPMAVLVVGKSCMGKTTLSSEIVREFPGRRHVEMDRIVRAIDASEAGRASRESGAMPFDVYGDVDHPLFPTFLAVVSETARRLARIDQAGLVLDGAISSASVLDAISGASETASPGRGRTVALFLLPVDRARLAGRISRRIQADIDAGTRTVPVWEKLPAGASAVPDYVLGAYVDASIAASATRLEGLKKSASAIVVVDV